MNDHFTPSGTPNLVWFENLRTCEGDAPACKPQPYQMWFLADRSGRVLCTIDGPTPESICYTVAVEGNAGARMYLFLDSAKQYSESRARGILYAEIREIAIRRRETRKR